MFEISLIGQIQVFNRIILIVQHQTINSGLIAIDISDNLVTLHRNNIQQVLRIELVIIWKFISISNDSFLIVEWKELFHVSISYQTIFSGILFLGVVDRIKVKIRVF